MFQLGFKETAGKDRVSPEKMVQTAVLLEVLSSKASPLYEELLEKGLINTSSFGCEYFEGPGYAAVVFRRRIQKSGRGGRNDPGGLPEAS